MWGIPHRGSGGAYVQRFIPTYVGHTFHTQKSSNSARGSSPHTWGIQLLGIRLFRGKRFIPTYVGHTKSEYSTSWQLPVHPHLRGAYLTGTLQKTGGGGSSPHTWGIRPKLIHQGIKFRFIPTYVGHTTPRSLIRASNAVHPHLRGAYHRPGQRPTVQRGSSPPTWGIQLCAGHGIAADRFIPTYVGHTATTSQKSRFVTVHPHLRGAYPNSRMVCPPADGSSPPTWGIRQGFFIVQRYFRFIPTYVGHTVYPAGLASLPSVHPHLRGAYYHTPSIPVA